MKNNHISTSGIDQISNMIQTPGRIMKSISPKLLRRKIHIPQVRVEDFGERRASCPAFDGGGGSANQMARNKIPAPPTNHVTASDDMALTSTNQETITRKPPYRSLSPQPQRKHTLLPDDNPAIARSVSDPDVSLIWSPIIHRMNHGKWVSCLYDNRGRAFVVYGIHQ